MKHITDARLARDIARKQYADDNARRERWIIAGMILVGFCTAFLLSVTVQLIQGV